MSRFLHFCCIVVLVFLTGISLEIPEKKYGEPDWYAQYCWFANWRNPPWPVDCATNVPLATYYSGRSVIGLRETDREQFLAEIQKRGCLIAGIDYYELTNVTPLEFPKLLRQFRDQLANGSVIYVRICRKDKVFTYEILGASQEARQ